MSEGIERYEALSRAIGNMAPALGVTSSIAFVSGVEMEVRKAAEAMRVIRERVFTLGPQDAHTIGLLSDAIGLLRTHPSDLSDAEQRVYNESVVQFIVAAERLTKGNQI